MSTPISFSSKPPSLFGNASVPKQQEEPSKQRRAQGKRKKSKPKSGGGDTEMVSFAHGLIDSPPPYYQTRKKEFTFSEDASETEARSINSPKTENDVDFSKMNLGPEKSQVPLEGITARKSGSSVSEGADTESDKSEGGDTEMVSFAPGLIDSPLPYYQTRKKEFTFSKDASETEARSIDSPETLSDVDVTKVNLRSKKRQVQLEGITVRKSGGSVSEGADTESDKSDSTSTDSSDGDSHSDGECLESVIGRRLFELPCTRRLVDSFKAHVKKNVLKQIRGVVDKEPTTELVLEIANSIDLLRLLGASTPMLDDIGSKAREGALLYQEGLELMNKGQEMLRSCISDIYSLK